jgi:hypothetical protein
VRREPGLTFSAIKDKNDFQKIIFLPNLNEKIVSFELGESQLRLIALGMQNFIFFSL